MPKQEQTATLQIVWIEKNSSVNLCVQTVFSSGNFLAHILHKKQSSFFRLTLR